MSRHANFKVPVPTVARRPANEDPSQPSTAQAASLVAAQTVAAASGALSSAVTVADLERVKSEILDAVAEKLATFEASLMDGRYPVLSAHETAIQREFQRFSSA